MFMWQVRMGRNQGKTGQNASPEPSGMGYRVERDLENVDFKLGYIAPRAGI